MDLRGRASAGKGDEGTRFALIPSWRNETHPDLVGDTQPHCGAGMEAHVPSTWLSGDGQHLDPDFVGNWQLELVTTHLPVPVVA